MALDFFSSIACVHQGENDVRLMSATGSVSSSTLMSLPQMRPPLPFSLADNNKRDGELRKALQITAYFISTFDSVS